MTTNEIYNSLIGYTIPELRAIVERTRLFYPNIKLLGELSKVEFTPSEDINDYAIDTLVYRCYPADTSSEPFDLYLFVDQPTGFLVASDEI